MKLYDFGPAANAQRVRVFLAEKGIDVPAEQLNVREDRQFIVLEIGSMRVSDVQV